MRLQEKWVAKLPWRTRERASTAIQFLLLLFHVLEKCQRTHQENKTSATLTTNFTALLICTVSLHAQSDGSETNTISQPASYHRISIWHALMLIITCSMKVTSRSVGRKISQYRQREKRVCEWIFNTFLTSDCWAQHLEENSELSRLRLRATLL